MTGVAIFAAAVAFWWFVIRNILKGAPFGEMALKAIAVVVCVVALYNGTHALMFGSPKDRGECITPIVTVYGRDC